MDIVGVLQKTYGKEVRETFYLDLGYFTALGMIFLLGTILLQTIASPMIDIIEEQGDLRQEMAKDPEQVYAMVKDVFLATVLVLPFMYLLYILAYSVFRGLIWSRLQKKRWDWSWLGRFFLFNLIVRTASWSLLAMTVLIFGGATLFGLYIGIPLLLHLTNSMNIEYIRTRRIRKAIIKGVKHSLDHADRLVVPYLLIGGVFLILKFTIPLTGGFWMSILALFLYLTLVTWSRALFWYAHKE